MLKFQPSALRAQVSRAITRPLDGLVRRRVSPNLITTLGVGVNLAAGAAFFRGSLRWGGALVMLGGLLDIADGHVARAAGLQSKFGSFYDSTTDRIAEVVVFLGILSLYLGKEPNLGAPWMAYVVAAAIAGSLMVSYVRAKAESVGIDCRVGLMQRAERIILLVVATLGFGTWQHGIVLTWVMIAMAVLTNLTALYRIWWVGRALRHLEHSPAPR
ncbi:MAG TPA: CDP-alcohol phosphatidyltransferase family protein [Longimicrobium sp.]